MIGPGQLIDVWEVLQKIDDGTNVFGVFLTEQQARDYLRDDFPNEVALRVVRHKAFRPNNELRVLLIDIRSAFHELVIDYRPDTSHPTRAPTSRLEQVDT